MSLHGGASSRARWLSRREVPVRCTVAEPVNLEAVLMGQWFNRFAHRASTFAGHYVAFLAALAIIVVWAVTGPFFGFSETWQLVINTGTTIVTFLMVFLI